MTDSPTEQPLDDDQANPVHWRLGFLTVVFAVLVSVCVLANWVLSARDDLSPPTETTIVNVAEVPTGALGGQPAPAISFVLFDGSVFDLDDHLASDGRPVVLNLWASWCFPCRTEMPEFSQAAAANPNVAFVGVAVDDSQGPAEAFADEIGVNYPLGIDDAGSVVDGYPYVGLPTTYLIGADGIVTHQISGEITGSTLQAFIDYDFNR